MKEAGVTSRLHASAGDGTDRIDGDAVAREVGGTEPVGQCAGRCSVHTTAAQSVIGKRTSVYALRDDPFDVPEPFPTRAHVNNLGTAAWSRTSLEGEPEVTAAAASVGAFRWSDPASLDSALRQTSRRATTPRPSPALRMTPALRLSRYTRCPDLVARYQGQK